jgi:tRNA uridine 5-carbamoylmethylation protein Kti12
MKNPNNISKPLPSIPPVLIILIGLPASGKSIFAQQIAKNLIGKGQKVSIIDTDKIRFDLFGPDFNPDQELQVIETKHKQIAKVLKPNSIVIVDDMHYYASMRHEMYILAKKVKGLYIAVEIQTPMEQCIIWNTARGSPIPNTVIQDIHKKIDHIGKKYRWDRPFFSIDLSRTSLDIATEQFITKFESFLHQSYFRSQKTKSRTKSVQHDISPKWEIITRKFFGDIINSRLPPQLHAQIITNLKITNKTDSPPKMIASHLIPLRRPFLAYLKALKPDLGKEKLPSRETLGNLFLSFLTSKVK